MADTEVLSDSNLVVPLGKANLDLLKFQIEKMLENIDVVMEQIIALDLA